MKILESPLSLTHSVLVMFPVTRLNRNMKPCFEMKELMYVCTALESVIWIFFQNYFSTLRNTFYMSLFMNGYVCYIKMGLVFLIFASILAEVKDQ